ncbi:hypothetical protein V8D89_011510 [Ganoderma adspersum]
MPVPFEALIPFGLVTIMFAATGTLLNTSKRLQNQGKPVRYNVDAWDDMMMDRDKRLTGHKRGQQAEPHASEDFETNSVWYTERAS